MCRYLSFVLIVAADDLIIAVPKTGVKVKTSSLCANAYLPFMLYMAPATFRPRIYIHASFPD